MPEGVHAAHVRQKALTDMMDVVEGRDLLRMKSMDQSEVRFIGNSNRILRILCPDYTSTFMSCRGVTMSCTTVGA